MNRDVNLNQPPEEVFRWLLLSDPRVARLLGTSIYAMIVPGDATLPFAGYSRQSIDRQGTLASGPSRSSVVTVELNVYAATYGEAREIASAVRERIDGFYGEAYGLDIGGIQLTSETDDFVTFGGEQTATAYQVTMNFSIRWQEVAA